MSTVISVEHLSKAYQLGQIGTGTLTNDLKVWWARKRGLPNPLLRIGESDHGNRDGETIWALKDVSFTVEQGEVLGIIGRNGAGKSTLLKVLSRITAPTSGQVKVKGRIASLLEVGTGFHPDLTGRENIYLNGSILGMKRKEIDRKFDEIVDFAEIEKFIDTPVKRYSSGMYVRLAFAVAAHLEPEILLVDEVLAVGDAEFQKKCLGKMGDIAHEGRTVLFVSHNMAAVNSLCVRGMRLNAGTPEFVGPVDEAVLGYLAPGGEQSRGDYRVPMQGGKAEGNGAVVLREWWIEDGILGKGRTARSCQDCAFRIRYEAVGEEALTNVSVTLTIKDRLGQAILTSASWFTDQDFPVVPPAGIFTCVIRALPLAAGSYRLYLYASVRNETSQKITDAGTFAVAAQDIYGTGRVPLGHQGNVVVRDLTWSVVAAATEASQITKESSLRPLTNTPPMRR